MSKKSTATLAGTFKCVSISGLDPTTIRIIRSEIQPSYTDRENEEVNALFRANTTLDWLETIKDSEDERASTNFSNEDYQFAYHELSGMALLQNNFDYFSIDSVD